MSSAKGVRLSVLLLLLLLNVMGFLLEPAGVNGQAIDKDLVGNINHWVNILSEDIENLRQKLNIEAFETAFEENGVRATSVSENDGASLVERLKVRLEEFLFKNEEHVEKVRIEAENSFAAHVFRNYSHNCLELRDQPFLRATALNKILLDSAGQPVASKSQSFNASSASHGLSAAAQAPVILVVPQTESNDNFCATPTGLELRPDPRLYNVDTNRHVSTAHVPSNIYDASTEILNVANWSRVLDKVFVANAESDPMLKWQYFGNIEGLFKIYPGIQWYIQTRDLGNKDTTIDFFDCRTQYWYLLAASYPKDMVILLDNSGSMKGRRSIIANMTLTELLYTMNVNDFFNVIMFMNSSLKYISDSFNFTMMQATEKNKYTIMDILKDDELNPPSERKFSPLGISDYKEALGEAFQLLDYVKRNATHMSSGGVQNIVLISDGAPQTFPEVFQQFNPDRQVRVFTFLVGHEAAEEDNVKRIACSNRGYFVQISTLSDVKENVQRYIPVIARTNAHARDYFFVWTGVHRNQIKTQNPNAIRVSHSAAELAAAAAAGGGSRPGGGGGAGGFTVFPFSTTATTTRPATVTTAPAATKAPPSNVTAAPLKPTVIFRPKHDSGPHVIQEEDPAVKNRLFISVAQSAYDIRLNETLNRGLGRLIGVSGIDVPTDHLERLGPAWELGALAYMFMVTNNGHILFHPEFRPFDNHGTLRLFFNNRDVADIEYPAEEEPAFNAPNYSLPLRLSLIQRETGRTEIDRIKTYEDFTRGYKLKMKYFYAPLNSTSPDGQTSRATPFSLALALPWRKDRQWPAVLSYTVQPTTHSLAKADIDRLSPRLFNSTCQSVAQSGYQTGLAEFEFCQLPSSVLADYNRNPLCALSRVLQASRANQTGMRCLPEYLTRIFVDAISTESAPSAWQSVDNATLQRWGASLFFLWTNTGLLRWFNHTKPLRPDFVPGHRNGSRESLYEKTVHLAMDSEPPMSVLSVPTSQRVMANIKRNDTFPRAFPIYLTTLIRTKLPAESRSVIGVAGAELDYAKLEETFIRVTNSCADTADAAGSCVTCSQLNVRCYLLDYAGFVVVSETRQDVGKAFDQVNCGAMRALVRENLYESLQAYDYQAICIRKKLISASASSGMSNPFRVLMRSSAWLLLEGFLLLSDLGSSIFQAMANAANDAVVSLLGDPLYKLSPEQCQEVESQKPRRAEELRERIDARVEEIAQAVRAMASTNEAVTEVKKALVQPYCVAMLGKDQEGCAHLCRRLKQKFDASIYSDLMGNCPKRIVKESDCVLRRDFVKWTGRTAESQAPIVRSCGDFGYCAGEGCADGDATKFQLHVRTVPRTNLVFLAVVGDPNCNCRGCTDVVGMTELTGGPGNYTPPPVPRARPPWGLKDVVLLDNGTICSKRAVSLAPQASTTMVLLSMAASVTAAIRLP